MLNHKHVQLNRSLSHRVSQENHLEYHIISTLYTEETNTSFHLRLRENNTPNSWASPAQGHTTFHLRLREESHTQLMGFLTPLRGTTFHPHLREEPHTHLMGTPNSWAHPTHGLSLRWTHSVCILEDVSRNCNHQHSLSASEAFSTKPSLSRKYSNFVMASGLVKMSAICSWVGRY
jgi:hypothetical protein